MLSRTLRRIISIGRLSYQKGVGRVLGGGRRPSASGPSKPPLPPLPSFGSKAVTFHIGRTQNKVLLRVSRSVNRLELGGSFLATVWLKDFISPCEIGRSSQDGPKEIEM